jgi:hypothetical protein
MAMEAVLGLLEIGKTNYGERVSYAKSENGYNI